MVPTSLHGVGTIFSSGGKMLVVETEHLVDDEERDEIITEAIKMIISQGIKSKISSRKNRQKMLENFGEDAFLLPTKLKFPIMNPTTGEYDCSLLYIAMIRTKQYSGIKTGYRELHQKAKRLFNENGCQNKFIVRIHDNIEPTDLDLADIVEIFS
jgi:hypothetical protein